MRPRLRRPGAFFIALLLALPPVGSSQAPSEGSGIAGNWAGFARLTNDWPGHLCRYEGSNEEASVRLEISSVDGRLQGSVAIDLPVPEGVAIALVHPHLELETKAMREALAPDVPLTRAVAQWADCAALVVGLYEEDWDLISRALVDRIAQPARSPFIPGFADVCSAAVEAGAVGAGLSGSGPSMFGFCKNIGTAEVVADAMMRAFGSGGLEAVDRYVSLVDPGGARIVKDTT